MNGIVTTTNTCNGIAGYMYMENGVPRTRLHTHKMREQPLIVAYNTIVEPPIMDSPVNLHNVNSNLQSRSIPHTLLYCVLPCTNELNCYQYISLHE